MADSQATVVPSPSTKVVLQECGLGHKEVTLPLNGSMTDVHEIVLNEFPALNGVGYELCRSSGSGRKRLETLGYMSGVDSLKIALGQAKCYIRPIQQDLPLENVAAEAVEVCLF